MGCSVLSARLSMRADILKPLEFSTPRPDTVVDVIPDEAGWWDYRQDPDSGALVPVWVTGDEDDPDTTDIDESQNYNLLDVPCEIRAIMSGGIRVAGNTQRFDEVYHNIEWVNATFPKEINVTKNDKVTNIRNAKGLLIWRNDEGDQGPTVFNVMGASPVLDPFGNLIEWKALLQRADVQIG